MRTSRFNIPTKWRRPLRIGSLGATVLVVPLLVSVQKGHNGSGVSDTQIRDPETEITAAHDRLGNIISRLSTSEALHTRPGLGPQTSFADRAYNNAQNFFEHHEYLSTIRELNNFLNLTQVPEIKSYLRAQYMLGRSYEAIGYPAKSLRAYFRYLSSFLTAEGRDPKELLDVLRRMVPLAAGDTGASKELNELVASITSLDLPDTVKPAVFYLSGKAVANAGSPQLAEQFLNTTLSSSKDPTLNARTLYLRALLALGARDYERAEETLSEAIQQASEADPETRDLARLALARVAIHRKKAETALKYYAMIEENSEAFHSALFESAFVHLKLRQDETARTKALQFLAKFPEDPQAFELRTLLAYLDLRAGDVSAAQQSIDAADKQLSSIGRYMNQNLSGLSTVNHSQLSDFLNLTRGQVTNPPTVDAGYKLFMRLAEVARRLADARGEIRNVYFTLGRASLSHLRPQWANRAEQLAALGDEILEVGHRVIAAERHLYKGRLDAVDWQMLTASENRRTKLLTPLATTRRKMTAWASDVPFFQLTAGLAGSYDRLRGAQADLATSRYLLSSKDAGTAAAPRNRVAEMEERVSKMTDSVERAVELLRREKVKALLEQSPHRIERKFLSQYAVALHEEALVVAKAREGAKTTAETLLASDSVAVWKQWEFASSELFRQIAALDKEMEQGIAQMLGNLEEHEHQHQALSDRLGDLTQKLEGRMGQSLAYLIEQYSGAIDARLARHKKWQADMEWLAVQTKSEEEKRLDSHYQLEQQILKDQLLDLKQGVLWQWPK